MKKVVEAYHYVSTTDEFKELERLRFDASCNEASALANARHQEKISMAKEMLADGVDVNTIARYTKLTVDEILKL